MNYALAQCVSHLNWYRFVNNKSPWNISHPGCTQLLFLFLSYRHALDTPEKKSTENCFEHPFVLVVFFVHPSHLPLGIPSILANFPVQTFFHPGNILWHIWNMRTNERAKWWKSYYKVEKVIFFSPLHSVQLACVRVCVVISQRLCFNMLFSLIIIIIDLFT